MFDCTNKYGNPAAARLKSTLPSKNRTCDLKNVRKTDIDPILLYLLSPTKLITFYPQQLLKLLIIAMYKETCIKIFSSVLPRAPL